MPSKTETLLSLLDGQPVIPVLKIDDVADAVPLARALARGGLPMIEITLRTPRRAGSDPPRRRRGRGSHRRRRHHPQRRASSSEAAQAGSKFIVSPGITRELLAAAGDSEIPLLPGAITPGEIMAAREAGLDFLKFFPAEQAGGAAFLKALASPLADVKFCPTGGVTRQERDRLSAPAQRHLRRRLLGRAGRSRQAPATGMPSRRWRARQAGLSTTGR